MTIIEIAVVFIAACELFRCLTAGLASIKQFLMFSYFEKEWERLRERIGLGATLGAALGGTVTSFFEKVTGMPLGGPQKDGLLDLFGFKMQPGAKGKTTKPTEAKNAQSNNRPDAPGKDNPSPKAS